LLRGQLSMRRWSNSRWTISEDLRARPLHPGASPRAMWAPNSRIGRMDGTGSLSPMAFPGIASGDDELFARKVYVTALGGGMSSRLFSGNQGEPRALLFHLCLRKFLRRRRNDRSVRRHGRKRSRRDFCPGSGADVCRSPSLRTGRGNRAREGSTPLGFAHGLERPSARANRSLRTFSLYDRVVPLVEIRAKARSGRCGRGAAFR